MVRNYLRHGSNTAALLVCAAILAAAATGLLHLSPWLVLVGAIFYWLSEYTTHRFLFHARPSRFGWLRAKQHRLHYDHHVDPARLDLLFLPIWYVVPNALLVALVAYSILRDVDEVAAMVLGAMLALLQYEWVHFIAHQPYTPKTAFGRWMKRYHLRHHFVNEHLWFGVSNPLMDFVYGTYRDLNDAARSGTTKILYKERKG